VCIFFQQVTSTGRPFASVPFHCPSGSPWVAGFFGCNTAPSLRGWPLLPVGAGVGRYTRRLVLRRPNTPIPSALQRHQSQLESYPRSSTTMVCFGTCCARLLSCLSAT